MKVLFAFLIGAMSSGWISYRIGYGRALAWCEFEITNLQQYIEALIKQSKGD